MKRFDGMMAKRYVAFDWFSDLSIGQAIDGLGKRYVFDRLSDRCILIGWLIE